MLLSAKRFDQKTLYDENPPQRTASSRLPPDRDGPPFLQTPAGLLLPHSGRRLRPKPETGEEAAPHHILPLAIFPHPG